MIPSARYLLGFTILLALLAGCSPSTQAPAVLPPITSPSPTVESSPVPFDQTFESKRFGYTIAYPDSWQVTERSGEWKKGDLFFQNSAGVDKFVDGGDSDKIVNTVVIGSQPVPSGTTLDQWSTSNNAVFVKSIGGGCGEPETKEHVTLGGETAISFIYHCQDGYFAIYTYAVHEGQGYGACWVSGRGNEVADEETFNQFIKSFAFVP